MHADGEVAWDDVERLIDDLITNGADGIVVTGTTGETSTLTDAEKVKLVEVAKKVAAYYAANDPTKAKELITILQKVPAAQS